VGLPHHPVGASPILPARLERIPVHSIFFTGSSRGPALIKFLAIASQYGTLTFLQKNYKQPADFEEIVRNPYFDIIGPSPKRKT